MNKGFLLRVSALLVAGAGVCGGNLVAVEAPRGTVLELHSCELYAGGCVVSGQATLEGRYLVTAWNFTGGRYESTELAGLQVAVLEAASENLAAGHAEAVNAVVYLPVRASQAQRDALLEYVKRSEPGLEKARLATRTVPLRLARTKEGYAFSAGTFLQVKTGPLESCETGACGEALWYQPRTRTSVFTVAVNRDAEVVEPLLSLKWRDAGKRSVFLGRFGRPEGGPGTYVATAEICGPGGSIF